MVPTAVMGAAKVGGSDELWSAYLPLRMRLVAFRAGIGRNLPRPTRRLPQFTERVAVSALAGWEVYARVPRSR